MKTINFEIDKAQFIKVIKRLNDSDKLEIYNELKKSLFLKRFNKLLKSTQKAPLSIDEITQEVESVRKQRYEKSRTTV